MNSLKKCCSRVASCLSASGLLSSARPTREERTSCSSCCSSKAGHRRLSALQAARSRFANTTIFTLPLHILQDSAREYIVRVHLTANSGAPNESGGQDLVLRRWRARLALLSEEFDLGPIPIPDRTVRTDKKGRTPDESSLADPGVRSGGACSRRLHGSPHQPDRAEGRYNARSW